MLLRIGRRLRRLLLPPQLLLKNVSGRCAVFDGDDLARRVTEHLEQVRVARDSGFDGITIGHHLSYSGSVWLPPFEALARLVPEAEGMAIGTCMLLLPLMEPVHVAQQRRGPRREAVRDLDQVAYSSVRFSASMFRLCSGFCVGSSFTMLRPTSDHIYSR